jgi:pimeloyl-ACP methyl ester carboxylesterase
MVLEQVVHIRAGDVDLAGDLVVPERAAGIIMFAHGSGSSRFSPRNRFVAQTLQIRGFSTLLLDLLTPREEADDERTGLFRFDIQLLAGRLVGAVDWLAGQPLTSRLSLGLFGASTGAAAALIAAARRPENVGAVVSRGGRPDLAGAALPLVKAPTLFIVGSSDLDVLRLNRHALAQMRGNVVLELVPGATHLFEEPGALDQVADLASGWFARWLGAPHFSRRTAK